MLFQKLDAVLERIRAYDVPGELEAFVGELRRVRADLFAELGERLGRPAADRFARAVARFQLALIKEIPLVVDAVRRAVEQSSTHPAVRCALVGSLAYLVNPRDLISDDRPGGFGFVDDCMILRATMSEYFDMLPPGFTTRERERDNLRILAVSAAPENAGRFQDAIDGVWRLFHALLLLPPGEVERRTGELIRDPLRISFPTPDVDSGKLAAGPVLSAGLQAGAVRLENDQLCLAFPDGATVVLEG